MKATDNTIQSDQINRKYHLQTSAISKLFSSQFNGTLPSILQKMPRLFRSVTILKNIFLTGLAALIGTMIGGFDIAIIMVFVTTMCEEVYDSYALNKTSTKPIMRLVKDLVDSPFCKSLRSLRTEQRSQDESEPIYQKEATVMFTDIRNFSAISEQMAPTESFKLLKTYMNTMLPIINRHRGIVNQIMGDGILSVFHDSSDQAIEAAIDMQLAIEHLNDEQDISLRVGMGIATGTIVAGNLNSQDIGLFITSDTVNVAKRIEEMTKEFVSNILMCDQTVKQSSSLFKNQTQSLGQFIYKGKTEAVHVHTLMQTQTSQNEMTASTIHQGLRVA